MSYQIQIMKLFQHEIRNAMVPVVNSTEQLQRYGNKLSDTKRQQLVAIIATNLTFVTAALDRQAEILEERTF